MQSTWQRNGEDRQFSDPPFHELAYRIMEELNTVCDPLYLQYPFEKAEYLAARLGYSADVEFDDFCHLTYTYHTPAYVLQVKLRVQEYGSLDWDRGEATITKK